MDKKISELKHKIDADPENPDLYLQMYQALTHSKVPGKLPFTYKFVIGDWSGDGHSRYENYFFRTNTPREKIVKAYLKTARELGVAFHYPGRINNDKDSLYQFSGLLCNYEDSELGVAVIDHLKKQGLDILKECEFDEDVEGEDGLFIDADVLFEIFMLYVKRSEPDFVYNVENAEAQPINGYWHQDFNVGFGYGLFYS